MPVLLIPAPLAARPMDFYAPMQNKQPIAPKKADQADVDTHLAALSEDDAKGLATIYTGDLQ
jgi:hypothetical protein